MLYTHIPVMIMIYYSITQLQSIIPYQYIHTNINKKYQKLLQLSRMSRKKNPKNFPLRGP